MAMEAVKSQDSGLTRQASHKSLLYEHAHKSTMPSPMFQTTNEGSTHAPQFRSTVVVDGTTFVSPCTFTRRKEAEQYVAKFALDGLSRKIKHERIPLIHNCTIFCKSILHEYAAKMKIGNPTYEIAETKSRSPSFTCSVLFNGKSYTGSVGNSKKAAEQIAARAIIESILGDSNTWALMSQILSSKSRSYAAMNEGSSLCVVQDVNVGLGENHTTGIIVKEKEVQGANAAAMLNGKTPKAECIGVSSGPIENGDVSSAVGEVDPPVSLEARGLVPVCEDSCVAQIVQVKNEVPSNGISVTENGPPRIKGQKRPMKKGQQGSPKRTRVDEQVSSSEGTAGQCTTSSGLDLKG